MRNWPIKKLCFDDVTRNIEQQGNGSVWVVGLHLQGRRSRQEAFHSIGIQTSEKKYDSLSCFLSFPFTLDFNQNPLRECPLALKSAMKMCSNVIENLRYWDFWKGERDYLFYATKGEKKGCLFFILRFRFGMVWIACWNYTKVLLQVVFSGYAYTDLE